jgi:type VI secretion system protein ImpK
MAASSGTAVPASADRPLRENLALCLQEIFIVIVRLRADREPKVTDANLFRNDILTALKMADRAALLNGYAPDDVKLAVFAVVALLDESVLNSRNPAFADWHSQPLGLQLFRVQTAGVVFFQNLDMLLGRGDSSELADLLEVYQLCMVLGLAGRYQTSGAPELRSLERSVTAKISRIRRGPYPLSPAGLPEGAAGLSATVRNDPWIRPLLVVAAVCLLLSLALFLGFNHSLDDGVDVAQKTSIQDDGVGKDTR